MGQARSRRVRVRDDGSGSAREKDGNFAEFETEEAIVLLGDPGIGKTTLFQTEGGANFVTVRHFLIDTEQHRHTNPLFLDALDEYRTQSGRQLAPDQLAQALIALGRPQFRLSCRAADWFGSADQGILAQASASGRIIVLELLPLSDEEILEALQGQVSDPATFVEEARSAGLSKLLRNPQTLILIAKAWSSDRKPRNKFEAFEIGIDQLVKETNPGHSVRGASLIDQSHLLAACGAAASAILLSNSIGVSRTEISDGDGYISMSAVPHAQLQEVEAGLRRRVFTSPSTDRFQPTHRAIAEFLAARDLVRRVKDGLPIERVLALICGADNHPVSSLRGLYGWLMCHLGADAELYISRDPYGVATYGDPGVLPAAAQRAVWRSLRKLSDPWFLTHEDDRGGFRNLANANTVDVLKEVLLDSKSSVHLKIAVLEAIANSAERVPFASQLRAIVLAPHDNTWLRSTALRAYQATVKGDWAKLRALDDALGKAATDDNAVEVRVALLKVTLAEGSISERILSIFKQVKARRKANRVFGHFYPLLPLPSDSDLELLLDGAEEIFDSKNEDIYEIRGLYDEWLKRRLELAAAIDPRRLSKWLTSIRAQRDYGTDKVIEALRDRFAREPQLFRELILSLFGEQRDERTFRSFAFWELWQVLPGRVWPLQPSRVLLELAENERDPNRAAELFNSSLSFVPKDNNDPSFCDALFSFVDGRKDVQHRLGAWTKCKMQKWNLARKRGVLKSKRKKAAQRLNNIRYLEPRISSVCGGEDVNSLVWAARVYFRMFADVDTNLPARERLVSVTNEKVADAVIEGFVHYADTTSIPTLDEIVRSHAENSIPYVHILLGLSMFLRCQNGLSVPEKARAQGIALAATRAHISGEPATYNEFFRSWMIEQVRSDPGLVSKVLEQLWLAAAVAKATHLPGFYELRNSEACQPFLASLAAKLLHESTIASNLQITEELVRVLLEYDQKSVAELGSKWPAPGLVDSILS